MDDGGGGGSELAGVVPSFSVRMGSRASAERWRSDEVRCAGSSGTVGSWVLLGCRLKELPGMFLFAPLHGTNDTYHRRWRRGNVSSLP
jgi:hypothetical protein